MSSIARWSYKNTATIRPFVSFDSWTQEYEYGEEYEIACTWESNNEIHRDSDGNEFTSRYVIYTEDNRPKRLDQIEINGEWQEVRAVTEWDMSMFNDTPDYKVVT